MLAGGAARGAYEAGVLRFVYGTLARRVGGLRWPDVVSGTSVGALNGAFAAGRDLEGLLWLCDTWRSLEIPMVYGLSYGDLLRAARLAFRDQPFSLADAEPLYRLVVSHWPRKAIRRAVADGVTLMVGATDLQHGGHVLFVESARPPAWVPRPGVRVVHTRIRALHALASAALPLLFPPVPLEGSLLVDGGLRMNTPLHPVLRAGADRILVVSLKRRAQDEERALQPPNLPFLLGKTLNALLLDPVEQDLFEAQQINQLLRWGQARFGEAFRTGIAADLGLREAEILFLAPSEDLGALAGEIYRKAPPRVSGAVGALLQRASGGPDADLLSYVYFDRQYTGAIEQLGYEDAARQEEALARLFAPDRG